MKTRVGKVSPYQSRGNAGINSGEDALNFTTDMKRLGLMADIQNVQATKKKLIIKQRHISPPPESGTGIGSQHINNSLSSNVNDGAEDMQSTSITNFGASKKLSIKKSVFKFPFQRRARSLSLPKDQQQTEESAKKEG
jgi:hypothetical protein